MGSRNYVGADQRVTFNDMALIALALFGAFLIVAGLAFVSIPAAISVTGLLIVLAAYLVAEVRE